jgi:protein-S-isoprenylcysteine O-methyltransferase Ste14
MLTPVRLEVGTRAYCSRKRREGLATLVLIVPCVPGLTVRAVTEDHMLQVELPGYRDYATRVRWRVLPGVW